MARDPSWAGPSAECAAVLVVDDYALLRKCAQTALMLAGFRVLAAEDGVAALQALDGQTVDLVVTDMEMPRMGGLELATRLRQLRPDVKVLFVSGSDTPPPGEEFLAKPYMPSELVARVRALSDGIRAARQA